MAQETLQDVFDNIYNRLIKDKSDIGSINIINISTELSTVKGSYNTDIIYNNTGEEIYNIVPGLTYVKDPYGTLGIVTNVRPADDSDSSTLQIEGTFTFDVITLISNKPNINISNLNTINLDLKNNNDYRYSINIVNVTGTASSNVVVFDNTLATKSISGSSITFTFYKSNDEEYWKLGNDKIELTSYGIVCNNIGLSNGATIILGTPISGSPVSSITLGVKKEDLTDDFACTLSFSSGTTASIFSIKSSINTGYIDINLTGDDVDLSGSPAVPVFTPAANSRYNLLFYYDGLQVNCTVKNESKLINSNI